MSHVRDPKEHSKQQQQQQQQQCNPQPPTRVVSLASRLASVGRATSFIAPATLARESVTVSRATSRAEPNTSDRFSIGNAASGNSSSASTPIIALSKLRNYMHSSSSSSQQTPTKLTTKQNTNLARINSTKTGSTCSAGSPTRKTSPRNSANPTLTSSATTASTPIGQLSSGRVPTSSTSLSGKSPVLKGSRV